MIQKFGSYLRNANPIIIFVSVSAIVFISRLPFLSAGYGNDWDSWEMASAAREIATTGKYAASRLPGFPVPELIYSLIWDKGFLPFNVITAMLSAVGIGFFSLTLRKLNSKDTVIASIALAFIPAVYVNSTVTIDYVWALAFILAGVYFAQHSKGLVSGLFLGLAIGSRITSVLMIIPLGMILAGSADKTDRLNRLARFSLLACLIGVVSYVPVMMTYGVDFLTFYSSGYPPLLGVLRVFTFEVWGGSDSSPLGLQLHVFFFNYFSLITQLHR